MLASRPAFPSVTLVSQRSHDLPRSLETALGEMLEIAIHTVEGLRDHVARAAMLRARRASVTM